ncbi:MAG: CvpA family protein [Thermodesulfovibrionia bacterium]|nr:CvpA family protein [Thermodesulfovibrionia bacterium]
MNSFDIFVLVIMGITVAFGLVKGLVKQVFSIIGIVAGYLLSVKLYEPVSNYFFGPDNSMAKIGIFLAIFIACIIIAALSSKVIDKFMETIGIGWANRIAGGGLGFLKGLLIVSVIAGVISTFVASESAVIKKSVTLPYLLKVVDAANDIIPDNLQIRYRGSKEK